MSTLRQVDYTPRYLGFSLIQDVSVIQGFDQDLWQYATLSADFLEDVTFPPTKYFGNITKIQQGHMDRLGYQFSPIARAYAPLLALMNTAIKNAIKANEGAIRMNSDSGLELVTSNETNCADNSLADILYHNMIRLNIGAIGGQYSWNGNAAQQRDWLHMQIQEKGKYVLIGPPTTKQADLIYPMPKWHERIFDPHYGHWTEILVTVVAGVFFCINIGWAIFLPLNLNNRDVKASSPLFMGLMLVGSSLLYGSVLTMLPNIISKVTCSLSIWILDLGFILLFGPLLGKTLRLDRLYYLKSTKIITIRDKTVMLWVSTLVVCHLILLVLLTTVGGFERKVIVVDPIRVHQNYYSCDYDTAFQIMLYIITASNAILLLVCSVYAFRIRAIPIKRFNESKIIFFTVYNVTFFALLSVILAATDINRFNRFILVSIFIILGSAITVNTFFLHKTKVCVCISTESSRTRSSRVRQSYETNSSVKPSVPTIVENVQKEENKMIC